MTYAQCWPLNKKEKLQMKVAEMRMRRYGVTKRKRIVRLKMFGHIERRINDKMVLRKWGEISVERKSKPNKNRIEIIRENMNACVCVCVVWMKIWLETGKDGREGYE